MAVCNNLCLNFKAKRKSNGEERYGSGQKYCPNCCIYIQYDDYRCPCCRVRLRFTSRHQSQQKSFLNDHRSTAISKLSSKRKEKNKIIVKPVAGPCLSQATALQLLKDVGGKATSKEFNKYVESRGYWTNKFQKASTKLAHLKKWKLVTFEKGYWIVVPESQVQRTSDEEALNKVIVTSHSMRYF